MSRASYDADIDAFAADWVMVLRSGRFDWAGDLYACFALEINNHPRVVDRDLAIDTVRMSPNERAVYGDYFGAAALYLGRPTDRAHTLHDRAAYAFWADAWARITALLGEDVEDYLQYRREMKS